MPRRYMVQVDEDSNPVQSPTSAVPPPAPAAPSVSANNSSLPPRRRGVFVESEEEQVTHSISQRRQSVQLEADLPDFVSQRQQELEKMWRDERLQQAQAEASPVKTPAQTPPPVVTPRPQAQAQPQSWAFESSAEQRPPQVTAQVVTPIQTEDALPQISPTDQKKSEKLDKIEGFYRQQQGPPPKKSSKKARWQGLGRRAVRSKALVGSMLLLGFILTALFSGYMVVRADYQTVQRESTALAEDLQNGRFTSARERLQVLSLKEQRYRGLYQTVRPAVSLVQGSEKTTHLDQVFTLSEKSTRLAAEGLTLYNDVELAYRQFVGSEEGNTLETVKRLSGEFEGLYSELSTLQAEIQQLQNPYEIEAITKLKTAANNDLPQVRRYTLAAQKISQVMPSLLAEGEEKRYLVLLQNNAELRPTGGFIGSYALVRIRDGKLQEFTVEDVYEADGQLQGYVTPPEEIVQYLGEAQWFLRDVNWSPDFPKVAQRAAWFLDKTINTQVDGVIATNLSMVQKLIAVTGPLELVDYGEVITQDNLYESAEAHSELNFFPGSTQKKDFLSAVSQQLLDKIFYQPTNKVAMARALLDSAEEAELFMSVTDPQAEEVLATLGWNGALLTPNCPTPFAGENCAVDTVMQVEANVGVNKANQHLTRSIQHEVELMNDVARHTRTITFTNTAETTAWPAGDYKTYLRLFVPVGSQLRSAELDGQPLDLASFKTVEEDGKQVFGYYVVVPIKSSKTLKIFYESPLPVGYKTYALFEQKQSGVWNNEVLHSINVGQKNVVTVAPEPSEIDGRSLEFITDSSTHEFFAVELE